MVLEFLGDKVIGLVLGQIIYTKGNYSECGMTKVFQHIVANEINYEFSKFLRIG